MRIFPIIAVCTALLVGCEQKEQASDDPPDSGTPTAAWPATKKTERGSYSVTVNPTKGAIDLNKHFSLDVTIEASDGADSLQVKVDADMPAHQHGMNTQPELSEKGDSTYQVDGMLFHMSGEWVIMVDVTRAGRTERASFPVQVE